MNTNNLIIPNWPSPVNIQACTTTRLGGVSRQPYETLNLATHVGDHLDDVMTNRQRIQAQLSIPSAPFWLNQQHTNKVIKAFEAGCEPPIADASFSDKENACLAILTADCLPIIITDEKGAMIAAIHAGWRSMVGNIIANTIECMDTSLKLMAWLGPCIHANHYEVGLEVKEAFLAIDEACASGFDTHQTDVQKCYADLVTLGTILLKKAGVSQIYGGNHCTYNENRFYSYRRDGLTGRMATFIWKNTGK